jgi:hypothetical protein
MGEDRGWYRRKVGRAIELGTNRLIGTVLAVLAVLGALLSFGSETFSFATHWPGLVTSIVLLVLARLCFMAKKGIVTGFGEEPAGGPPKRSGP